jgi:hypothetical protein
MVLWGTSSSIHGEIVLADDVAQVSRLLGKV